MHRMQPKVRLIPWSFHDYQAEANGVVGGKKHLAKAEDMFNMIQNGTEVAEAVFEKNGLFKVKDVTPADFAKGE
jgi:hypothetical protein